MAVFMDGGGTGGNLAHVNHAGGQGHFAVKNLRFATKRNSCIFGRCDFGVIEVNVQQTQVIHRHAQVNPIQD